MTLKTLIHLLTFSIYLNRFMVFLNLILIVINKMSSREIPNDFLLITIASALIWYVSESMLEQALAQDALDKKLLAKKKDKDDISKS